MVRRAILVLSCCVLLCGQTVFRPPGGGGVPPGTTGDAPKGATYIVQQADATLSAEQALGTLATGILKSTTSTGVVSIATASDIGPLSPTLDDSDASIEWEDASALDATGALSVDHITEAELDAEAELESQLADVTDVFTDNDGALDDDDVTAADVGSVSASLDDTDASVEWEDAADLDATGTVTAASTTTAGKVELATGAEANTGTDATRAVTPDALEDWTGSAQVTTLGTIASGTWQGTAVADGYLGTGINADKVADASVSNAEFQRLDGLSADIQGQIDGKQPLDAALTALAGGSDFVDFAGPATAIKTFTLPNSNATLLYSGGALGTPASGTATNITGLPLTTGVTGILPTANGGTGIAYFTAAGPSVARVYTFPDAAATMLYSGGALGTPSGGTLTNATGLPMTTGVTGVLPTANGGTGIAYFTAAGPSTARVYTFPDAAATMLYSGGALGTPSGGTLTNAGGLPGTGVVNTPAGDIAAETAQAAIDELDDEKQPLDADLTALAALASTGLVARTGAQTYDDSRAIQDDTNRLTWANGDGVAGNPTPTIADNLAYGQMSFILNGGGTAIPTGVHVSTRAPADAAIIGYELSVEGNGAACSIAVDIWTDAVSTDIETDVTNADSICDAGTCPALANAKWSATDTLTSWTTNVAVGERYMIQVDSADCTGAVQLILKTTRD